MNKRFLTILGVMLVVMSFSCTKKPDASLTLSKSIIAVNETVTATSTSTNTNAYFWSIYDGTNIDAASSSQFTIVSGGGYCDNNVQFKIAAAGTYTVYLKAFNYKDGCNASETSGYSDVATAVLIVQ